MTLYEQDIVNNIPVLDLLQNISARMFNMHEENRRLKKQITWHDLRKNPNDLPPLEKGTEFVSINVLTDRGEIACYQHCHGKNYWRDCNWNEIDTPRAWREIPRFEEEEMGKRNQNMRKSRFEEEAAEYIKTHDDYRVFALDDADIMQIFKDGAEIGFQKGIKAKINTTTISDAPINLEKENAELKAQIEELKKYYEGFECVFDFKEFMKGGENK
jgi:hypothetical protein